MGMRENIDGGRLSGALVGKLLVEGAVVTLGGDIALGAESEPLQMLDPGGAARTVTLPAEASSKDLMFIISNRADAAENITVENDAAATIATLTGSATAGSSETGIFWCDGTSWYSVITSTYDET